jgi:hypothetical protein
MKYLGLTSAGVCAVLYGVYILLPLKNESKLKVSPPIYEPQSPGVEDFVTPIVGYGPAQEVANISLTTSGPAKVNEPFDVELNLTGKGGGDLGWLQAKVRLSDASSQIDPKDPVGLLQKRSNSSVSGTVRWSVKSSEPRLHRLDLNMEAVEGHFVVTGKPYLDVAVESTWAYYVDKSAPLVASFGGSLLTLPGILAYLEARKKKRREALKKHHLENHQRYRSKLSKKKKAAVSSGISKDGPLYGESQDTKQPNLSKETPETKPGAKRQG